MRNNFVAVSLQYGIKDGKAYALKLIDMEHMTDEQRREALNEMEITRSLKHPHIISCTKAFEEDNKLNIVLEYC